MKIQSEEQLAKTRKFLLVVPVIVIPFLTLFFWALGGGKGNAATVNTASLQQGLNPNLPGASNKDDGSMDKMGFYEQAMKDSMKRKDAMNNDPYYKKGASLRDSAGENLLVEKDSNEQKVYNKLAELHEALEKTSSAKELHPGSTSFVHEAPLPKMPQLKKEDADPETEQLNGMLEKILDIQHPERVKEKLQQQSRRDSRTVFPVAPGGMDNKIAALEPQVAPDSFSFQRTPVIHAEIGASQEVVAGSTVKIRLLEEIFVQGILIPVNTFVSGIVSLQDSRLQIEVSSLYFNNIIFPVQLSVHDPGGMKGLELHASIESEVASESSQRAVQGINIASVDPSLGAQVASAGVQAAKAFMVRKARIIKVPLRAGQRILLVSSNISSHD